METTYFFSPIVSLSRGNFFIWGRAKSSVMEGRSMNIMERVSPMHTIWQQITSWFQQISSWLPGIPSSMLIFFAIVAGFLAFALVILILRLLWAIVRAIFGVKRRRRSRHPYPNWERQLSFKALRQQHHW